MSEPDPTAYGVPRRGVERSERVGGLGRRRPDEHREVREDRATEVGAGRLLGVTDECQGAVRLHAVEAGGDEHDVGGVDGEGGRVRAVRQREHRRSPLRRPRDDRRAVHRDVRADELGAVDASRVDEAAGGDVADDRVVVPAVPEAADDLGDLARASAKRAVVSSPPGRRPNSAASRVVGLTWIRHPARPSETVVEGLEARGDVEGLGVRHRDGRHQPDRAGRGSDRARDEQGVESADDGAGVEVRRSRRPGRP